MAFFIASLYCKMACQCTLKLDKGHMHTFTYRRGAWEDGHALPDWENDEPHDDYLLRLGYESVATHFGHPDGNSFNLFQHTENGSFLADVSFVSGRCFEVYLPDFPSAMLFIKDHAAAFTTDETSITNKEILALLEKLFQSQHGHPSHEICEECDPEGWKQVQEIRQRRIRNAR